MYEKHIVEGQEQLTWDYQGLSICYKGDLNGGGTMVVPWYVDYFRSRFPNRRFKKALEWCAGPGFIGFSLLREGICEELCLADINPDAMDCVAQTISDNPAACGDGKVTFYTSDNFAAIPEETEQFDLVVGNPPFAENRNAEAFGAVDDDLRPCDPGWKIHQDFYANVRRYLLPEAVLCIAELEPFEERAFLIEDDPRGPWDIRDRPPIQVFRSQIEAGALALTEVVQPMAAMRWFWLVVAQVPQGSMT